MWLDFDVRDNRRCTFHWRKVLLLIILAMQLLSSPDVNWWTGVVWIIVMFLSAVWTLILTAPIHCRASIAETLMQRHISTNLMKKQTHPDLAWPEDEHIYSSFYFWVKYSFNVESSGLMYSWLIIITLVWFTCVFDEKQMMKEVTYCI